MNSSLAHVHCLFPCPVFAVHRCQLKGLAKSGLITPETIVETEDGKTAPARKVKGLTFATPAPPETTQSAETEIYGLAQSKPPVEVNPFTVPVPEEINPFTSVSPKCHVDSHEQPTKQSESTHDPSVEEIVVPFIMGLGVLLTIVFIGIGIASYSGYQEQERKADVLHNRQMMEQKHQGEMRVQDIQRESQAQQARTRAKADIEKLKQEHNLRLISNQLTMTSAELDGQRRILALELEQFESRKDMELLTTYGISLFSDAERIKRRDASGNTQLHIAARDGKVEIVKDLISKGADVNAKNDNGGTPLHGTSERKENIEIVKYLIFQFWE